MSYVVISPCIGCKCASCAEMCPVDAFREGEVMLFIDPDVCIGCDACRTQCLRGAIYPEHELPEVWSDFVDLNAQEAARCRPIVEPQQPIGFPDWQCSVNRPNLNLESQA